MVAAVYCRVCFGWDTAAGHLGFLLRGAGWGPSRRWRHCRDWSRSRCGIGLQGWRMACTECERESEYVFRCGLAMGMRAGDCVELGHFRQAAACGLCLLVTQACNLGVSPWGFQPLGAVAGG